MLAGGTPGARKSTMLIVVVVIVVNVACTVSSRNCRAQACATTRVVAGPSCGQGGPVNELD